MKNESTDNDYHVRPEGHLVLVTCGHRGQPNRSEEKRVSRLMRKSGFIPMLDDVTNQQAQVKEEQKKKESERIFERTIEQEEADSEDKKTTGSNDHRNSGSRAGSKGKTLMPNIRVVSYNQPPKISPMANFVIDVEETVHPQSNSHIGSVKANQIRSDDEQDKSQTAQKGAEDVMNLHLPTD